MINLPPPKIGRQDTEEPMVAEGAKPKEIVRRMDARPRGYSIVSVGDVQFKIFQVSNRGHKGFLVVMPEGGKIEHRKSANQRDDVVS